MGSGFDTVLCGFREGKQKNASARVCMCLYFLWVVGVLQARTMKVSRVGQRHDKLELQREALLLRRSRRSLGRPRLFASGRHLR